VKSAPLIAGSVWVLIAASPASPEVTWWVEAASVAAPPGPIRQKLPEHANPAPMIAKLAPRETVSPAPPTITDL
jgi:hypothetical protein